MIQYKLKRDLYLFKNKNLLKLLIIYLGKYMIKYLIKHLTNYIGLSAKLSNRLNCHDPYHIYAAQDIKARVGHFFLP